MIKIDALIKKFDKPILDHFNLSIKEREKMCLFGPSGCGKTTFLRLLAGIEKKDSGNITGIDDLRISYLFQEDRLLPWFNILENLLAVNKNQEACENLLDQVGLKNDKNKLPTELSGGMKRRVAIAKALLFGGGLYLMDEPFQGLDEDTKQNMMKLIQEYTKESMMVFVTHDKKEAFSMAERILFVTGPPFEVEKEILNRPTFLVNKS